MSTQTPFLKLFNTESLGILSAYMKTEGTVNSNDIGTAQKKYLIIAYCLSSIEDNVLKLCQFENCFIWL